MVLEYNIFNSFFRCGYFGVNFIIHKVNVKNCIVGCIGLMGFFYMVFIGPIDAPIAPPRTFIIAPIIVVRINRDGKWNN